MIFITYCIIMAIYREISAAGMVSCPLATSGTKVRIVLNWQEPGGAETHGLPTDLRPRARPASPRTALSGVRRDRARRGTISTRDLAFARGRARNRGVVLERLSW